MTDKEMWKAVCENNADYDGLFFYAVKTTKIYCRPSCRSKTPRRENVCFFHTGEEARRAGFHPCKRCRSDLIDYQPMREIAASVRGMIDVAFARHMEIGEKLRNAGMTERRLTDIFKEEYGMTPRAYADSLRLREAKRLLAETDRTVIDIAYSVGFGSQSSFYHFFKKEIGVTPSEYRKKERNAHE